MALPLQHWRQHPHSLSWLLLISTLIPGLGSLAFDTGTWPCDALLSVATGFFTALVVTIASRITWERDADPTRPPEK